MFIHDQIGFKNSLFQYMTKNKLPILYCEAEITSDKIRITYLHLQKSFLFCDLETRYRSCDKRLKVDAFTYHFLFSSHPYLPPLIHHFTYIFLNITLMIWPNNIFTNMTFSHSCTNMFFFFFFFFFFYYFMSKLWTFKHQLIKYCFLVQHAHD